VRIAPNGSWLSARVCGSLALCFILFKKACALSAAKRHLKGIRLWSGCGGYAGAGRTFSFPSANIRRVWGRTRIRARGQTHAPVSLPNGSIARGHAGILYPLLSLCSLLLLLLLTTNGAHGALLGSRSCSRERSIFLL